MEADGGDHWRDMTARWRHVGRPLKPGPDDIALFERFAAVAAGRGNCGLDALLLGVTPEVAECRWPSGTRLTAVDFSLAMIRSLWPARAALGVACANWLALPMASRSVGFVIGDGCHAVLAFPRDVNAMAREVARVLRPGGMFVMRAFVRPDPGETAADVERDLAAGRIGSVHVLKWRLFAALSRNSESGTLLGDVWNAWDGMRASAAACLGRPGWSEPEMGTIEVYRGDRTTRFYFPKLEEIRGLLLEWFSGVEIFYGNYELADRCPIIVLKSPNVGPGET
jgi:SAM-dependent methyltransferase